MTQIKGLGFVLLNWPALNGGGGGTIVALPVHTESRVQSGSGIPKTQSDHWE